MDMSTVYHKLPKRIKNSEKMTLFMMRIYKILFNNGPSNVKPNQLMNFLFKSTNVKATGTLRYMQLVFIELLRFVVNVCDKYGLDYWLTYGTLLGAVRHEGFIPWDDDLDICMMRKDYDKLIEVLPIEINKYDFLKENCCLTRLIKIDEDYFKDFNGVYDLGSDKHLAEQGFSRAFFIQFGWLKPLVKLDIFPFDYIKEEYIDYYNKNYLGHKYYFRVLFNDENFSFEDEFKKQYEKLGYSIDETDYIAEGIDSTFFEDFGVFEKDIIFPLKNMKFEGFEFKCPNKSHDILKVWYGESYMDIPSNLNIHNFDEYNEELFDSKEQMNQYFNEIIEYLKEVNDNFS